MCEFCNRHAGNWQECGKDYLIHPCGNGDLGVRTEYIDGSIILFKARSIASGYFDINYCPICGRKIGHEKDKEKDSELVLLQQVLDDMYNPDGGLVSMAARDYYYQHYATTTERKKMDREDKNKMVFAVIFLALVGFAVISAII